MRRKFNLGREYSNKVNDLILLWKSSTDGGDTAVTRFPYGEFFVGALISAESSTSIFFDLKRSFNPGLK